MAENKTNWGAVAGAGASVLGIGLGNTWRKQQMGDQRDLMAIQLQNQKELNKQMQEIQMENWEKTNYKAQVQQMEKAGLNVGMMYGGQGQGGQIAGGSGGSASGGSAPTNTGAQGMGMMLQAAQAAANIELTKAQTKKVASETPTGGQNLGNVTYEKLRQDAIGIMEDNVGKRFFNYGDVDKVDGETTIKKNMNLNYGFGDVAELSPAFKQFTADLLIKAAEEKKLNASAALDTEKKENIWNELMIAAQNADANMINAKANELSKEWETGEFTNWKTWADLAKDAVRIGADVVKPIKGYKPRSK